MSRKKKYFSKFFAFLLAMLMVVVMLPMTAFADVSDIEGSGTESDPWVVYSWEDLKFCLNMPKNSADGTEIHVKLGRNLIGLIDPGEIIVDPETGLGATSGKYVLDLNGKLIRVVSNNADQLFTVKDSIQFAIKDSVGGGGIKDESNKNHIFYVKELGALSIYGGEFETNSDDVIRAEKYWDEGFFYLTQHMPGEVYIYGGSFTGRKQAVFAPKDTDSPGWNWNGWVVIYGGTFANTSTKSEDAVIYSSGGSVIIKGPSVLIKRATKGQLIYGGEGNSLASLVCLFDGASVFADGNKVADIKSYAEIGFIYRSYTTYMKYGEELTKEEAKKINLVGTRLYFDENYYNIEVEDVDLGTAGQGYNPDDYKQSITITNNGIQDPVIYLVRAENTSDFVVAPYGEELTLGDGQTTTKWSIKPAANLAPGEHEKKIIVGYYDVNNERYHSYAIVKFTVEAPKPLVKMHKISQPETSLTVGYTEAPSWTFTLANRGEGDFAGGKVTLSGTDAESFIVSPTSIDIAAGSTQDITVTPKSGLAVGHYSCLVSFTDKDGQELVVSRPCYIDVRENVSAARVVLTDIADSFKVKYEGYTEEPVWSYTLKNEGSANFTGGTVSLSGENADSFTVSPAVFDLAVNEEIIITVTAQKDLPVGQYNAAVSFGSAPVPDKNVIFRVAEQETVKYHLATSNFGDDGDVSATGYHAVGESVQLNAGSSKTNTNGFDKWVFQDDAGTELSADVVSRITNGADLTNPTITITMPAQNITTEASWKSIGDEWIHVSHYFYYENYGDNTWPATATYSELNYGYNVYGNSGETLTITPVAVAGFQPRQTSITATFGSDGADRYVAVQYYPNQYQLTWDYNGGTLYNGDTTTIETVYYKDTLQAPQPQQLDREGYIFAGWDYATDMTNVTMPDHDLTIKALWVKDGHTHDFTGNWQYDADQHWHACTANDGVIDTKIAHVYDSDSDADCDTCGYTRPITITVADPEPVKKELDSIFVEKAPHKVTYYEGTNFDARGMVVKASYTTGDQATITNYTIENGTNLTAGQASVTISYTEDGITKTTTQPITVKEIPQVVSSDSFLLTVEGSYSDNPGTGRYPISGSAAISAGSRNGYSFSGWTCDTADVTIADVNSADTTVTVPDTTADNSVITVTAHWTEATPPPVSVTYTLIKGNGQTVTKGNIANFVSDAPFEKFDKVQIDGADVAASNYTAVSGSTDVTFTADYIKSLATGEHSIAIVSSDGQATGKFTVKDTASTDPTDPSNPTDPTKPDDNQNSYTITASAGKGGSINPGGSVSVQEGTNKTFTITPDSGYKIDKVLVDGTNVGAVTTYTFDNVKSNHFIEATFVKKSSSGTDDSNKPNEPTKPAEPNKPADSNKPADKPATVGTGTTNTVSPKTGDTTNIMLWLALMLVSIAGVGACIIGMKRSKRTK